jgi:chromate transporter
MKKKDILIKLFTSTLLLSAFTFGGGYVIVTLMRKKFVHELHWIDEDEMIDLIAIAQSSPGAIAVNGAIVVGYKLCGIIGVIVSVIATIIPPFVIISIVSMFYNAFKTNVFVSLMLEGMQAGVGAVICSVVYEMSVSLFKEKNNTDIIIMVLAFILNYIFKINVIFIIILTMLYGLVESLYKRRTS